MSDRYPIMVERMKGSQALRIACERCHREHTLTADEILCDGFYNCPAGCGGMATYKFVEADHKCPNCGKLGFFPDSVKPNCSRVCKLQSEYALTLVPSGRGESGGGG